MNEEKFDIIFKGQLVKGADLAATKANMGKMFKLDAAKVNAMFSGKPITLKKSVDIDTAAKYRAALKKAGALVELMQLVEKPNFKAAKPMGRAVFALPEETPPLPTAQVEELAQPLTSNEDEFPTANVSEADVKNTDDENEFDAINVKPEVVDEINQDLAKAKLIAKQAKEDSQSTAQANAQGDAQNAENNELYDAIAYQQTPIESPSNDNQSNADNLPLAEVVEQGSLGGELDSLVESQNTVHLSAPDTIPDYDVMPVGADVLAENERVKVDPVNIDTSELGLKELGGLLVEVDEIERPDPISIDVDHFNLADVGEDLLSDLDKMEVEELVLDLDHITVAELGGEFDSSIDNRKDLPVIDVSHISLTESQ